MKIGVLKEPSYDNRVAVLPEHIPSYSKLSANILVETSAGSAARAHDEDYRSAGAQVVSRQQVLEADIILCIHLPPENELQNLQGKTLIGTFQPLYNKEIFKKIAAYGIQVFSLDMLPRTTRAQSMDVLSSQANIAGYKAVLLAANVYPRYLPMFMTAAGSIPPAKFLILGAGVAGLQAIATARRLGAVVEVFDTRPAVKEEVLSLGAKFVEVEGAADATGAGGYAVEQSEEFRQRQKERIAAAVKKADIIITTAQIFGKKAPILVTTEMIETMKNGSVIIDLAASTGGNTELTHDNETVETNGVLIVGNSNLPSDMPYDASKMYGKNMLHFLELIADKEKGWHINFEDELIKGACMTAGGALKDDRLIT